MSYNLGYDLTTTSKLQSERYIFDFNKMMVHIPSNRTNYSQTNKKAKETPNSNRLETTSITPLDMVSLDNNVLFISTLDSNWTRCHNSKSSIMMKRQTSHTPERTKSIQHHTRRYSQPESNIEPTHPPPPPFVYYNDKRNLYHNRRTSVQSDAASSTELIRRFSSESTTSSVVTHLSWVATAPNKVVVDDNSNNNSNNIKTCQSNVLNDAQTIIMSDKQQQQQQQQQKQHQQNEQQQYPKQDNVSISCTSSTNTTNTSVSISSLNKQQQQQKEEQQKEEQQQNICDTRNNPHRHFPSAHHHHQQQQQQQDPLASSPSPPPPPSLSAPLKQQQQQQVQPIWSDPIKIKENPVRYEYTVSYLSERDIPPQSTLPLTKPCVFYFSDSNTKETVTVVGKTKNYSATIKTLFECDTAWNFSTRWRLFNKEVKVSQLYINQNLYCFIKGVEPMWEDKVNQDGGRLTIHPTMLDDMFEWLLFCLVGGNLFDQGAVGVVVSCRARGDRIELWLDSSASQATLPNLKNTLCSMLPESCHLAIRESRFKKHF